MNKERLIQVAEWLEAGAPERKFNMNRLLEITPDTDTTKIATNTAKNKADAKKAADAILEAGYYGTTGEEAKPAAASAPEKNVKSATVTNVHMCCAKCSKAANEAIKSVAGITKGEAVAKETSFTVEGDFKVSELLAAIQKAGFNGKVK